MNNIFQDPIKWAKTTAGTKTRAGGMMLMHILLCVYIAYSSGEISKFGIFFAGAFLPSFYIFGLYRLLSVKDSDK